MFEWYQEPIKLHSGEMSHWKVDCDSLTDEDWEAIAALIGNYLVFGEVVGIPEGGNKLASALQPYVCRGGWDRPKVLVVDDVLTTGKSISQMMAKHPGSFGVVLFARGKCPLNVYPVFQQTGFFGGQR